MASPSTSIIIPVRNGAAFVAAAIESALSQIGNQDEIIVIDDGSTDATSDILRSFAPRITSLQSQARGVSAARNTGLRQAQGDFIAFLDHDDLWPAGRHRPLVAALLDHTHNAAAGRVRVLAEDAASAAPYASWDGGFHPGFLQSGLFARDLIVSVGFFDETMAHGEDNDFYLRLKEAQMKIALCDVDTIVYRRHAGNATNAAPPRTAILTDLVSRKLARRRETENDSEPAGPTARRD